MSEQHGMTHRSSPFLTVPPQTTLRSKDSQHSRPERWSFIFRSWMEPRKRSTEPYGVYVVERKKSFLNSVGTGPNWGKFQYQLRLTGGTTGITFLRHVRCKIKIQAKYFTNCLLLLCWRFHRITDRCSCGWCQGPGTGGSPREGVSTCSSVWCPARIVILSL